MIINRLQRNTAFYSRVEIYTDPKLPTIEMTIVRNDLATEPTIILTYEQAQSVVDTLQRLLSRIDEHAAAQDVTQLHPRAEALMALADQRIGTTSTTRKELK